MADGDVVVITGASAGVGRATARLFAEHGARLALLARGEAGLGAARQDLQNLGGDALTISLDVADAGQVEQAADRIEDELGAIDVWINNAMTTVFGRFMEVTAEEYRRVTEVTYLGVVYGTQAALKHMLPRNRGSIVQVGSALAYRGIPLQSAYCGAKHAIQGFTESLRSELIHDEQDISVSMVQLPALNTPQFGWCETRMPRKPQPVPPIYEPEVAARAIHWAAYHERRELVVGFNAAVILWGNKFFPGFGDRYLARTAFEGQQHNGPVDADRPSNLWEPVDDDEDYGASGDFSERARSDIWQLWLNTHRWVLGFGLMALLTLAIVMLVWIF